MRINNHDGLPAGDTENPVLIAAPRHGVPGVINSPSALARAAQELLTGTTPWALDVERAQGFRYGSDPYLVQIRREDVGTFLIDPVALPDLSSLTHGSRDLFVLHAADQDLPNLHQLGLEPGELFDTEVAARLVGLERFGLAAVCEQVLGLALIKDHQAANWSVRPLPADWLRYAALDVELLTELYRKLSARLHELGRWEWAIQEFAHILNSPPPAPKADRWRALPGASTIKSRANLAVLEELWTTREQLAASMDVAPGRLVRNAALVRAAQQPPRNRRTLLTLSEFRSPVARQHADAWLRAIKRGLVRDEADLPPLRVPLAGSIPEARHWARLDPQAHARLTAVRSAVQSVAATHAIAPDVLLEPKVQRWMAWAPLDSSCPVVVAVKARLDESSARPWQKEQLLAPLAAALTS